MNSLSTQLSLLSSSVNELDIQPAVQNWLSSCQNSIKTTNGRKVQIISAGELNVHAGPDFRNMAVIIDGNFYVGDGEFHKSSSDWFRHNHHKDPKYNNVILEIVINKTAQYCDSHDIILVHPAELSRNCYPRTLKYDTGSIEVLSDLAILRLRRKAGIAMNYAENSDYNNAAIELARDYVEKIASRSRRPQLSARKLSEVYFYIENSEIFNLIDKSINSKISPDEINSALLKRITTEGPHLRQEFFINAIMPIIFAIANDHNKYELLLWYRSARTKSQYGLLRRRFPGWPQEYIWQQQGMLEHLFTIGQKTNN